MARSGSRSSRRRGFIPSGRRASRTCGSRSRSRYASASEPRALTRLADGVALMAPKDGPIDDSLRVDPVVVTGAGVVSPIGVGCDAFWDALAAGRHGIRPVERFSTRGYAAVLAGTVPGGDW